MKTENIKNIIDAFNFEFEDNVKYFEVISDKL